MAQTSIASRRLTLAVTLTAFLGIAIAAAGGIHLFTLGAEASAQELNGAAGSRAAGDAKFDTAILGATIAWTNTGSSTAWYTATNWTPNTSAVQWLTTDIAQFNNTGSATIAGINMNTAQLSIGAIEITSARTRDLAIGNSSTAAAGTLTLNGETVNSVANVILRNASGNRLTLRDYDTGSGKTMNVALGNPTENVVSVDGAGDIRIESVITGASRNLTIRGAGLNLLRLSRANTYSGTTVIQNNGALSILAGGSIANSGSLEIQGGGYFDVSENAAGYTLAADQDLIGSSSTSLAGFVNTSSTRLLTTGANTDLQFPNYGGSAPPLKVNGGGSIVLASTNTAAINVSNGGTPLGLGDHPLIGSGSSNTIAVTGTAPAAAPTITGDGICSGCSASLVISSGQLVLRVVLATYSVTYNGNSNTGGTPPVDGNAYNSGDWAGVAGPSTLVKSGNIFGSWNTAADGSGTRYMPGQSFAVTADTTLYAQWTQSLCFMQNPTGSLDTSFGTGGKVGTNIAGSQDYGYAQALQPDGKIVVAGVASNGSDDDFALTRYNTNGTLDTSFNGTGKVTTAFSSGSSDIAYSVAVQPDGKIVAAGSTFSGSNSDFALARYNANGTPDTSFNLTGIVTTDLGFADDYVQSVAIQPDGKIVAAGYRFDGTNFEVAVARYNASGSLDTSFNGTGMVVTAVGSGDIRATSVLIQSNGRLVAAGFAWDGVSDYDLALVRYNADGSIDTSFGVSGIVTTDVATSQDYGFAAALQPDGKIVVAGSASVSLDVNFVAARYNSNGSLDTSFNGTGMVTTAILAASDQANGVAIQPDGKIVAAGWTDNGAGASFALVRYNAGGSLDTSFNGTGKVITPVLVSFSMASAVSVQGDGRIVAAGFAYGGADFDFALARYGTDCTTAAPASISGRVTTADGYGIRNAVVSVTGGNLVQRVTARTSSFGYYSLEGLEAGHTYVVMVNAKRYTFAAPTRVVTVNDSVTDIDFIAEP